MLIKAIICHLFLECGLYIQLTHLSVTTSRQWHRRDNIQDYFPEWKHMNYEEFPSTQRGLDKFQWSLILRVQLMPNYHCTSISHRRDPYSFSLVGTETTIDCIVISGWDNGLAPNRRLLKPMLAHSADAYMRHRALMCYNLYSMECHKWYTSAVVQIMPWCLYGTKPLSKLLLFHPYKHHTIIYCYTSRTHVYLCFWAKNSDGIP